jgi:thioredoxin 1
VEFDGKLIVAKVDVDSDAEYSQRYGVQGLPTLLFFRSGREVQRLVGSMPEAKIRDAVEDLLARPA